MKLKSIRSSHAHHLPVCQLVVVIDDGQQIDRVADGRHLTVSFVFHIPPFLTSLEHLSTVSYAKFLKCKQKTSLDFLIPWLLRGPYCTARDA